MTDADAPDLPDASVLAGIDPAGAPPDDASDLFGYPPRPRRKCFGCGLWSEPFYDGCCWLCVHTGQRDRVVSAMPPHYWDRLQTRGEG